MTAARYFRFREDGADFIATCSDCPTTRRLSRNGAVAQFANHACTGPGSRPVASPEARARAVEHALLMVAVVLVAIAAAWMVIHGWPAPRGVPSWGAP